MKINIRMRNLIYKVYPTLIVFGLSAIIFYLTSPFILTADGGTRIIRAENIANGITNGFSVLPPLNELYFALNYYIFKSHNSWMFAQIFLSNLSFYLAYKLLHKDRFIAIILTFFTLIIFFVTALFPIAVTDSVYVFIGLVFVSYAFISIFSNREDILFRYIIMLLVGVFFLSFRMNSYLLFPFFLMLISYMFLKRRRGGVDVNPKKYIIILFIFLIGFSTTFAINKTNKTHAECISMIWDMVKYVKESDNIAMSKKVINDIKTVGDIDRAVQIYGDKNVNNLTWEDNPPFPVEKITVSPISDIIYNTYIKMIYNDLQNYLKMKTKRLIKVYGFTDFFFDMSHGFHRGDTLDIKISKIYNEKSFIFLTSILLKSIETFPFFFLSGAFTLLTLLIIMLDIFIIKNSKQYRMRYLFLFTISSMYYFSFALFSQSHEFRYFMPTAFIYLVIIVSILYSGIIKAKKSILKVKIAIEK